MGSYFYFLCLYFVNQTRSQCNISKIKYNRLIESEKHTKKGWWFEYNLNKLWWKLFFSYRVGRRKRQTWAARTRHIVIWNLKVLLRRCCNRCDRPVCKIRWWNHLPWRQIVHSCNRSTMHLRHGLRKLNLWRGRRRQHNVCMSKRLKLLWRPRNKWLWWLWWSHGWSELLLVHETGKRKWYKIIIKIIKKRYGMQYSSIFQARKLTCIDIGGRALWGGPARGGRGGFSNCPSKEEME